MPRDSADTDQDSEVYVMWPDRLSLCLFKCFGMCALDCPLETFAEDRVLNKNYTIV